MSRRRSHRSDDGLAGLDAIYGALNDLFAGSSCPRSTRCCRFRQTGRTPYVSPIEMRRVLIAIDRRGGRLPRGPREPGDCPLLQGGSCTIHPDRPFGCRTFFCEDATLPHGQRRGDVEVLARELRALSERLGETELVPLTTHLDRIFDREGRRVRGTGIARR
jgi:Fe-S-cluster containining protein